jgi:D-cysteine desulfhydrase
LLDQLFGAQLRSYERERFAAERDEIVAAVLADLQQGGRTPRWTPMGASEPLACWGYIRAAAELAEQLYRVGIHACDVVVAVSSGATHAGLLLGKLIHRLPEWNLYAVPVSDDVAHHRATVGRLCAQAIAQYDLPCTFDPAALQFIDGYIGEGYAIPYVAALEAVRLAARTEAVVLDPVYTAKAFCAVLDGVRQRRFGFDRPLVFVHTGGIFSNFAWPETLL